jgi:hypothetical protein
MRIFGVVLLGLSSLYGQTCAPARIQSNGSVTGRLDDSSCRLTDASVYAAYRLDLPARGQLRIDLSTGSDLLLILRDSSGMKLESGVSIRRAIEAGSYTLLVNGRMAGQVGDFSVQARFTIEPGIICTGFPSLGLNQSAEGVLGASGCTLPDGTLYEGYTLTTLGAGTLTVSISGDVPTGVIVRGDGGSAIASGSGEVSVAVDRDSRYEVVVYAAGAGGAYRIATTFQPGDTETCRPSESFAGVISVDSCWLTREGSSDLLFYNYYPLAVPAGGLVDLQVSSSDFEPSLSLLDAGGNLLASDASEVRMQLAPGNYTVQVFSSIPSGGAYRLDYQLTAGTPQPCSSAALNAGDSAAGTLASSSCRGTLGPADQYSVALATFGTLDLTMSSDALVSRIAVLDAKDNLMVVNEDAQRLGAHLSAVLPAGSYYVVAAAASGSGFYQLTSQFTAKEAPSCGFVPRLEVNTAYVARLGSGSCADARGQAVDYFDFTLAADSMVATVMTSTEVDGFLSILDSNGSVLRSDDNSYGFGDPLILQYLPAGNYRIAARTAGSMRGYYRVDLLAAAGPRPPFCTPRGTLAVGGSLDGTIGYGGCQYPDSTFADIYRFDLAVDTTIDVLMTSKDFDAALVLLDAKGNVIDGGSAHITHMLAAGTYFVAAKSATDYTAAGAYTLALAQLQ